jgi:hypothetical protein
MARWLGLARDEDEGSLPQGRVNFQDNYIAGRKIERSAEALRRLAFDFPQKRKTNIHKSPLKLLGLIVLFTPQG